jgi:hypothetical protein
MDGLSNEKVIAIKPSCPSPAVTVRQARSQALRWETLQIAEYGVTVGGVHALAGGTRIIRLWAPYPATAAAEPYAARWPAIEQHLLQCYHRPRFLRSAIRPPGTHRGKVAPG